ncbi:MAG: ABC transporter substrate-binding protein [Bradyrhizobium sp.]
MARHLIGRREFMMLLGGTAVGWPRAAGAQQPAMPSIGFLSGRSPGEAAAVVSAFRQGLSENGFIDGQNLNIEFRWAEGRYDRLKALADDLVARHVAAIAATGGSVSGLAAKAETTTIPIVFASGGDAVKLGLVASLNRPGGNVTGVNLVFGALGAKRLELLRRVVPTATKIAMLVNPNYPSAPTEVRDVEAAARALGLQLNIFNARSEIEIEPAFAALAVQKAAALLVADDPYLESLRQRLAELATRYSLPAIYISRDFVEAGGLMSYGPSITDAYRLVGVYVGRILKGEKPADLPVMQPTKFELVINLKTAKTLKLDLPPTLLALADAVVE